MLLKFFFVTELFCTKYKQTTFEAAKVYSVNYET